MTRPASQPSARGALVHPLVHRARAGCALVHVNSAASGYGWQIPAPAMGSTVGTTVFVDAIKLPTRRLKEASP